MNLWRLNICRSRPKTPVWSGVKEKRVGGCGNLGRPGQSAVLTLPRKAVGTRKLDGSNPAAELRIRGDRGGDAELKAVLRVDRHSERFE